MPSGKCPVLQSSWSYNWITPSFSTACPLLSNTPRVIILTEWLISFKVRSTIFQDASRWVQIYIGVKPGEYWHLCLGNGWGLIQKKWDESVIDFILQVALTRKCCTLNGKKPDITSPVIYCQYSWGSLIGVFDGKYISARYPSLIWFSAK